MKGHECRMPMHRAHCCCGPHMGHPPMHFPMGRFPLEMKAEEEAEALKRQKELLEKRLESIGQRLEEISK